MMCVRCVLLVWGPQAKELRAKLNLPEGYTPLHCVLLGYKDMEGKTAPRKENEEAYANGQSVLSSPNQPFRD